MILMSSQYRALAQVLFCGHMMRAGYACTHAAAERAGVAGSLKVMECSVDDIPAAVADAHVAVPLMSRFDAVSYTHLTLPTKA